MSSSIYRIPSPRAKPSKRRSSMPRKCIGHARMVYRRGQAHPASNAETERPALHCPRPEDSGCAIAQACPGRPLTRRTGPGDGDKLAASKTTRRPASLAQPENAGQGRPRAGQAAGADPGMSWPAAPQVKKKTGIVSDTGLHLPFSDLFRKHPGQRQGILASPRGFEPRYSP